MPCVIYRYKQQSFRFQVLFIYPNHLYFARLWRFKYAVKSLKCNYPTWIKMTHFVIIISAAHALIMLHTGSVQSVNRHSLSLYHLITSHLWRLNSVFSTTTFLWRVWAWFGCDHFTSSSNSPSASTSHRLIRCLCWHRPTATPMTQSWDPWLRRCRCCFNIHFRSWWSQSSWP